MAATVAVEIIGPTPGTLHQAFAVPLGQADLLDFTRDAFDPFVQPEPVFIKADEDVTHAWGNLVSSGPSR